MRVKGVSPSNVKKVESIYWSTIMHGGANERQAFYSILQDINPVSAEVNVPKNQIVKVLLAGTGFRLPKKYRQLRQDRTTGVI